MCARRASRSASRAETVIRRPNVPMSGLFGSTREWFPCPIVVRRVDEGCRDGYNWERSRGWSAMVVPRATISSREIMILSAHLIDQTASTWRCSDSKAWNDVVGRPPQASGFLARGECNRLAQMRGEGSGCGSLLLDRVGCCRRAHGVGGLRDPPRRCGCPARLLASKGSAVRCVGSQAHVDAWGIHVSVSGYWIVDGSVD